MTSTSRKSSGSRYSAVMFFEMCDSITGEFVGRIASQARCLILAEPVIIHKIQLVIA